jgi:hypothetical protein
MTIMTRRTHSSRIQLAVFVALAAGFWPVVIEGDGRPVTEGQRIRFDTFGDEQLWTDTLVCTRSSKSVDPTTALKVGLKVDADALPPGILAKVDLKSGDDCRTAQDGPVVGLKPRWMQQSHRPAGRDLRALSPSVDNPHAGQAPQRRLAQSGPQRQRHHRVPGGFVCGEERLQLRGPRRDRLL